MKRSVISSMLIGLFLLVSNLAFAQDAPSVNEDNPTTVNQADSGNSNPSSDVPSAPSDTQGNSVNATSDSGNNS